MKNPCFNLQQSRCPPVLAFAARPDGGHGIRTYLLGSTTWVPASGWPPVKRPKLKVQLRFKTARQRPGGSR